MVYPLIPVFPREPHDFDGMVSDAIELATDIFRRACVDRELPTICVRPLKRGRWNAKSGYISLPVWLWDAHHSGLTGFRRWYVAHELAHYMLGRPGHDLHFQLILARLAPNEWHWEETYKPKMYRQAFRHLHL